MTTPNPKGYPTATLPDAPEIPHSVPHWSWDKHGARKLANVQRAVKRAWRALEYRALLESL